MDTPTLTALPTAADLGPEAVALLSDLIRVDTTNPPGNERPAADLVAGALAADGIESRILESAPGRANLVARLRGEGDGAPLLLLGHLDVVYANPDQWTRDPFGGEVAEGFVWGRGALDMKGMVAVEVAALRALKRMADDGWRPARDVILLAVADEECSGHMGAGWMVDHHWPEIACGYVVNEGGAALSLGGRPVHFVSTGEKGYVDLRLVARGDGGHASQPVGINPVLTLSRALERVGAIEAPVRVTDTMAAFFAALGASGMLPADLAVEPEAMLGAVGQALGPALSQRVALRLHDTHVPTVVRAGRKANVIPATAEAVVNCRILPGNTPEEAAERVRDAVDDPAIAVTVEEASAGSESTAKSPFMDALCRSVADDDPSAIVLPILLPGMTDSRFFRWRGATAYGLDMGVLPEALLGTIHGADERVPVDNLGRCARRLVSLVAELDALEARA